VSREVQHEFVNATVVTVPGDELDEFLMSSRLSLNSTVGFLGRLPISGTRVDAEAQGGVHEVVRYGRAD
jgi:hypothetical protein